MNKEIEKWLNDKDFILAYRFNFDKANEVNEDLKSYVKQLQQENKELKQKLKTKHDGFMASVDECCEYATILDKFKTWLEEQHYDIATQDVLDKLQELKEGNK